MSKAVHVINTWCNFVQIHLLLDLCVITPLVFMQNIKHCQHCLCKTKVLSFLIGLGHFSHFVGPVQFINQNYIMNKS